MTERERCWSETMLFLLGIGQQAKTVLVCDGVGQREEKVAWRCLGQGRQAKTGVEDSSLVGKRVHLLCRKRKCCLVEAIVGQGDRQQQYYS